MQTLIIIDKQAISNAGIHYLAGKTGELVEVVDAQTTKELANLLEEHPAALVVMDFTFLDLLHGVFIDYARTIQAGAMDVVQ